MSGSPSAEMKLGLETCWEGWNTQTGWAWKPGRVAETSGVGQDDPGKRCILERKLDVLKRLFLWTIAHSEHWVRGWKARHDTRGAAKDEATADPRPWGQRSLLSRGQGVIRGLTKSWCSIKNQTENLWKRNSWTFYFLLLLSFCLKRHMQEKKKRHSEHWALEDLLGRIHFQK